MRWFDNAWIVETCILALILKGDNYGYALAKSDHLRIVESSLYPILRRLTAKGYLETYSGEHKAKLRKYYHITPDGEKWLLAMKDEWKEFRDAVNSFIEGNN